MKLVENSLYAPWQMWLMYDHKDAFSLLRDPSTLMHMLPEDKKEAGEKAIMALNEWLKSDRAVYRVIGISDWNEKYDDDKAAALAFAKELIDNKRHDGENVYVGNYWSRSFSGDPYHIGGGASMGYDPDNEGFPLVMSGTVSPQNVVWGSTIAINIAYPHEDEITVEGMVDMRYVSVDGDRTDFTGARVTGPYVF